MSAVARLEQQLPLVLDEYYARSRSALHGMTYEYLGGFTSTWKAGRHGAMSCCRAAEASRQVEQDAAVTFQSAWRGYFLRQQIKHIE